MALSNRVALRTPATTERTWCRIHPGMKPAMQAFVKRHGYKGVTYANDDGEVIVRYSSDLIRFDSSPINEFLYSMKRVQSDYHTQNTDPAKAVDVMAMQAIFAKCGIHNIY